MDTYVGIVRYVRVDNPGRRNTKNILIYLLKLIITYIGTEVTDPIQKWIVSGSTSSVLYST